MNRAYNVTCRLASQIPTAFPRTVSGSFSFGAYDAAKKYAADNLPGYEVIPGGVPYPNGRRFEAINHATQLGADIYVTETVH